MTKGEQLGCIRALFTWIEHYFVWGGMSRCMDCYFHGMLHDVNNCPWPKFCSAVAPFAHTWRGYHFCPHFTPEWWEEQGYVRDWGDAAVNNFPHLEILRKEENGMTKFVVLSPLSTRRPVVISANDPRAWGSY